MESSLRPATPEDLRAIALIESRTYAPYPGAAWGEDHFASELTKPYSRFWVLTDDETDSEILGYLVFWIMFDECQVINIVVDSAYRGLGLAQRMLRQAISEAIRAGSRRVILNVRRSNQAAVQLYQKVGLTITHVRKGFYSDGEDAYEMVLFLSESTENPTF